MEIHLDKRKHKFPYFDGTYKLLLDGKVIGTGNFIKGYTIKRKISPGKHKLTVYAPSGIISTCFWQKNIYHTIDLYFYLLYIIKTIHKF